MLGSQITLFVRSIVGYWVMNRWSRRMRSEMASSLDRIMPAWERPVSCQCLASRRKSLWLKVKMARRKRQLCFISTSQVLRITCRYTVDTTGLQHSVHGQVDMFIQIEFHSTRPMRKHGEIRRVSQFRELKNARQSLDQSLHDCRSNRTTHHKSMPG